MGKIYWLASYPKSGNTWLRVFLHFYRMGPSADLNQLPLAQPAAQREWIDEWLGAKSSDMALDTLNLFRPALHQRLAETAKDFRFVKTHEAFQLNQRGEAIFPEAATAGVVLLVRNPLEIAVSFANHLGVSLDRAIEILGDPTFVAEQQLRGVFEKIPEFLGSWSTHTESWLESGHRLCLVRYEDLLEKSAAEFRRILEFCGEDVEHERLDAAVSAAAFSNLQRLEKEAGFREKPPQAPCFFRSGVTDSWRQLLNPDQIERVRNDHETMMRRLNYWS